MLRHENISGNTESLPSADLFENPFESRNVRGSMLVGNPA